jgi:hypothetical protein
MQHFYDGQIRRYITQTIRVFSNFVVKYGDGSLHQIPVMYGDMDRQVANIIKQNSAATLNTVPRIAVYVTGLTLDRERLGDSTYISKLNFRERDVSADGTTYTQGQGRNYTVERLMPTPFKLTMKVDIWSSSTDQKLQILEQILVMFNPSLELQTNDNYIDWTSLTVLNLTDINWSSRTVPVGNDSPIDVGTFTLDTPIWISPPVKVKHLGVIKKIITSLYGAGGQNPTGYIDGLGVDTASTDTTFSDLLAEDVVTITNYTIQVYNGQALLLASDNIVPREPTLDIPKPQGTPLSWLNATNAYPGKFVAGSSRLFLQQPGGSNVVGTVAINTLDDTLLMINWDLDTLITNTGIDSQGLLDFDNGYNAAGSYRPNSPGTFDAIINPQSFNPGTVAAGTRYLIIEDIGNAANTYPAVAWGTLIATANDIIEYTGTAWHIVFNAAHNSDTMVWQTNIYTGVQYLWNGISWVKSFEGEYGPGQWRLEL